jgi:hypothetical protein
MKIPTTKIKGLIPKEKYIHESSAVYMPFEDIGYNKCCDEFSQKQLVVGLDRQKVGELLIQSELESGMGVMIDKYRAKMLVEALCSDDTIFTVTCKNKGE